MDWVETKLSLKFMAGSEDCWRWRMVAATTTTTLTRFIHLFSNSLMDKKSKRDFGFFLSSVYLLTVRSYKIHVAVGYDRWKWKAHKEEARLNKFHVNTHHKQWKTNQIQHKKESTRKMNLWNAEEQKKKFWVIDECKFTWVVLTLFYIRNCDAFHKLIHSHSLALCAHCSPANL